MEPEEDRQASCLSTAPHKSGHLVAWSVGPLVHEGDEDLPHVVIRKSDLQATQKLTHIKPDTFLVHSSTVPCAAEPELVAPPPWSVGTDHHTI